MVFSKESENSNIKWSQNRHDTLNKKSASKQTASKAYL